MSLLAIAWTIVAFLVGALVVVLCVVMANLFRVLTSTKDLIDGVTSQTVPLLGEVNTTVSLVNQELVRVDGILATAEGVTASVGRHGQHRLGHHLQPSGQAERVRLRAPQGGRRRLLRRRQPAGRGRRSRRRR